MRYNLRNFVLSKLTDGSQLESVMELETHFLVDEKVKVDRALVEKHMGDIKGLVKTAPIDSLNKVGVIINDIALSMFGSDYYSDMVERLNDSDIIPLLIFNNANISPMFIEAIRDLEYEAHFVSTGFSNKLGYMADSYVEMLGYLEKISCRKVLITDVYGLAASTAMPGLKYFHLVDDAQNKNDRFNAITDVLDSVKKVGKNDVELLLLEGENIGSLLAKEFGDLMKITFTTDNRNGDIKKSAQRILIVDTSNNIGLERYQKLLKIISPIGIGILLVHGEDFPREELNEMNLATRANIDYQNVKDVETLRGKLELGTASKMIIFDDNLEDIKELSSKIDYTQYTVYSTISEMKEFENISVHELNVDNMILAIKTLIQTDSISQTANSAERIERKTLKSILSN